jgi:hypothetical protein
VAPLGNNRRVIICSHHSRGNMKPSTGNHSAIPMAMSLLILGLCIFEFGCKGSDTTWSAESRSPDGKMIARAQTIVSGGFGTDGYASIVTLNWTHGSQDPVNILVFTDAPAEPESTSVVTMKWLTPTHLELTYKGHRTIGFQAVKADDIDISVRDVSSETPETPR